MDQALVAGWMVVLVLFLAICRRSPLSMPVLAGAPPSTGPAGPGDEDEQLPETDRAPRAFPWLPAAVASAAALRICLLVAVHR
jgi:hypothetical protein